MTDKEKAVLILEKLEEVVSIDWNYEGLYLKAIIKALAEIRKKERDSR